MRRTQSIFLFIILSLSAIADAKSVTVDEPETLESACTFNQKTNTTQKHELLNPDVKKTKLCLRLILTNLSRNKKVDKALINTLVVSLLPTTQSEEKSLQSFGQFDIDYEKIASVISLSKSQDLIKRYLDFIVATSNSADEVRSYGLAKLYTLQAPVFIEKLSQYAKKDRTLIINNLAWGLLNNYYPHLNKSNYKRLIVGEYWELVLEKKYKHSNIVRAIEAAMSEALEK